VISNPACEAALQLTKASNAVVAKICEMSLTSHQEAEAPLVSV